MNIVLGIVILIALSLNNVAAFSLGQQSFQKIDFSDNSTNTAERIILNIIPSKNMILPGTPLYPMKNFLEKAELMLSSKEKKQSIYIKHAQRRINEAKILISLGEGSLAESALNGININLKRYLMEEEVNKEQEGLIKKTQGFLRGIIDEEKNLKESKELIPESIKETNRSIPHYEDGERTLETPNGEEILERNNPLDSKIESLESILL